MTSVSAQADPVQRIAPSRVKVLCVDDEPLVLEGLALHLGRKYHVLTATSGPSALAVLDTNPDCAVVLSDMRMPGMDGATLLAEARARAPHATRMLLTGQTDVAGAAAAVNKGQLFRFLTKPCPVPDLLEAFAAAVEQHRLVTAERVLLRETLFGSIQALAELMAVVSPESAGRTTRVQRLVTSIAADLGWEERWQVELAAMLSQSVRAALPAALIEKRDRAEPLEPAERRMLDEAPQVAARLVAHVPRIEEVRQILQGLRGPKPPASAPAAVRKGIELLRAVEDFVELEARGDSAEVAIASLQAHGSSYAPDVLEALRRSQVDHSITTEIAEVPLLGLRAGMVVVDDVRLSNGVLLLPKGSEVTRTFIERAKYFRPGAVRSPLRVQIRRVSTPPP
ncbi:response regulator [Myxococcota bacterium]|nr:response regulator [Myxococcota bacterium]